jgi:hypothetical protein
MLADAYLNGAIGILILVLIILGIIYLIRRV